MKRCPECRRDYYDETLLYCLDDGNALLEGPGSGSEPVTAILDAPESKRTGGPTDADTKVMDRGPSAASVAVADHKVLAAGIGIVVIVLLAGFGYGVYQFARADGEKPLPRTSANMQIQRLTGDGKTRDAEISPDGKFLVYMRAEDDKESLWIKQVLTGSVVNVVKPGEASDFEGITFSPDGNFVFFNAIMGPAAPPTVYRVPTLGGQPTKFLSGALFLRFSADGKYVSYRRPDASSLTETVFVANSDGSGERALTSRSGKQFYSTSAAWSPDGTRLAVGVGDDDAIGAIAAASIVLVSTDNGDVQELGTRRWEDVDELVWHPSGDSLIVVATENAFLPGQIWEVAYPSGEHRKITNNLNGHYSVSITADGRSIVTGEIYSRSAIWVSPDLDAENAKQIMPSTGDTWGFSWTPDGRIVYSSDQSGDAEIWIMDPDGANARQLTTDRIFKLVPFASPDGRYIVYMSSQNGGQIVRIDIDGRNPLVLTKAIGADNPHISPDGQWVIYSAYIDGQQKVLMVPIGGGEEQILTTYFAKEPRYSHDGTRFACFLLDAKSLYWNQLAIVPAEGGEPISKFDVPADTNASRGPVWTPDDKGITLVVAPGEKQNLWLQPVEGGAARAMTDVGLPGIARRDYSRDGKRIAVVRAQGTGNAIMITGFR